ncbi:MAG: glycosyltransferase family 4 protein [Verrucomicrobiota bacterium]
MRRLAQPTRLGFIGLLRYPPNLEGIHWFLQKVWPIIKRHEPAVRLRLVGAGADATLAGSSADVDVLGWVSDPSVEIATWSAMIVPIRVGGGTRIKIAEGFGRGCPVVTTSLGAFGYEDVRSGEDIVLADSPEAFAQACVALIRDQSLGERLAANAWEKFCCKWTWDAMAPRVAAAVEQCLRNAGSTSMRTATPAAAIPK